MKKETTTTKPSNKKTARAATARKKKMETILPVEDAIETPIVKNEASRPFFQKYAFTIIAVLVLLGLAAYKFQYIFMPARVNGRPIYVWQYVSYLHKTYGKDALQTLTTQDLINQEIAKSGVKVSTDAIQKEVDTIDKQASASGGLQAMLTAQQMTLSQLKDQIRIQLAVKQILKDKIAVSDAEVQDAYTKNKDFFKNMSEADAKQNVREQLENQKFQKEASAWLSDLRQKSKVQILFPGLSN